MALPDTWTDGARRRGVNHIAFAVGSVDDVDAAVARLVSLGVRVLDEAVTTRPGVRAAFFEGPEGIRIEVMHRAPGDYRTIPATADRFANPDAG